MKRVKNISIILMVVLFLLSACSQQVAPVSTESEEVVSEPVAADSSTEVEVEEESEAAEVEEPEAEAEKPVITVMAAASLTEPFTDIGELYETEHEGVEVIINFAGSQQLAQQITQGAPADVYASANTKQMGVVIEDGRIDDGSQQIFIRNKLVMIYPIDNPADVKELADLTRPGLKVVLADKEVPVGKYSLEFLTNAVEDENYGSEYQENVLNNVVSYETTVKAVLSKVVLGEADAGIVYSSDVTGESCGKVGLVDIPDNLNTIATYPIAVLNDAENPEGGASFIEFVLSDVGQEVLTGYGFIPPVSEAPAESEEAEAAAPASEAIVVTDALGRTVEFTSAPQRIVIAGKASTLIYSPVYMFPEASERVITAASAGSQGIGDFVRTIDSAYDGKEATETDIGPEQIAALQPDAVFLKSYLAEKLGDPVESLGIPVVYFDFETPEQYWRDLETLGKIFQNEEVAEKAIAYYQDQMSQVEEAVASAEGEKPKQLVLYYSDKDGAIAFNVPPLSWMQTLLSEMAGGYPVWQDIEVGTGWTKVGLEQIAAWDADQIYIIAYFNNVDEVVAGLKEDPQWQLLRAVQEDQLYGFAKDFMSWDQADARWILGLKWLATKTNPDLFSDVDIQAETQSFYQELYGVSPEDFEAIIVPMFEGNLP